MLVVAVPAVAEDVFRLSTGFDFSSGRYGGTDVTDILYIPVIGKYESGDLTLKLTVPYIRITGPGGIRYDLGQLGQPLASTTRTTSSGLGDIVTSADYNFYSVDSLDLDVVGKVKFGTADANKGLGTGKNDFSAQIDGYYYTLDETTLFATVGYRFYGSPVANVTLNDILYGEIGANRKMDNKASAGAMLYMAQSPSIYSANQLEATVYISNKISHGTIVQVNASMGLASGSPDYGLGAMVTNTF
jgi:hypothetical protein